jgi:protein-disulfide isomerase
MRDKKGRKADSSKNNANNKPKAEGSSKHRRLVLIISAVAIPVIIGGIIAMLLVPKTPEPVLAIDGISCDKVEHLVYHTHSHIDIFVDGKPIEVPGGIGIKPSQCLFWLHTHSGDGVIHVESPEDRIMNLGQFFDIWQTTATQVEGFPQSPTERDLGPPQVYVSGKKVEETGYRDAKIYPNTEIAVVFGSPTPMVIPSTYVAGKTDLRLDDAGRAEIINRILAPSTVGSGPLGDPTAPVMIVEFGDYQCNSCGIFHRETQDAVVSNLVDTGKAQLLYKDFTLNDYILQPRGGSTLASEAAYCAGDQGKFWEYHDMLFDNQEREGIVWVSSDVLKGFASDVGVPDVSQFSRCLDSHQYASAVKANNDLVRDLGINATPTFIIINPSDEKDPVKLVGAYPYSAFDIVVNQMLTS